MTKRKPVWVGLVVLIIAGVIGGYVLYQQNAQNTTEYTVCSNLQKEFKQKAADLVESRNHKKQRTLMEEFRQKCNEYNKSPDYHYIALRYYITVGNAEDARHHVERLKQLADQSMFVRKHGNVRSIETLEETVVSLEKASEDTEDFGNTHYIKEPS